MQIQFAREKQSLSQTEAAKAWGIPVETLQSWEQGISDPRGLALSALRQIIDRALNTPPVQ